MQCKTSYLFELRYQTLTLNGPLNRVLTAFNIRALYVLMLLRMKRGDQGHLKYLKSPKWQEIGWYIQRVLVSKLCWVAEGDAGFFLVLPESLL